MPFTTPIIPILTSSPRPLSVYLNSRGFLVRPISYPTVPRGKERIRICLHAGNTTAQVIDLVAALREWIRLEQERQAGKIESLSYKL